MLWTMILHVRCICCCETVYNKSCMHSPAHPADAALWSWGGGKTNAGGAAEFIAALVKSVGL